MEQALIDHLAGVLQHAREHSIDLAAYLERLIEIDDRIANAPRAWAYVGKRGLHPSRLFDHPGDAESWGIRHNKPGDRDRWRVVPIALVELKEGE